jgi:hypothetical protein
MRIRSPRACGRLNIKHIIQRDGLGGEESGRACDVLAQARPVRAHKGDIRGRPCDGTDDLRDCDFTQIVNAYAEFSESLISALIESLM